MNINNSQMRMIDLLSGNERENSLIKTLLNTSDQAVHKGMDSFSSSAIICSGTYSPSAVRKKEYIADDILNLINGDITSVIKRGDVFECGEERFTADQIPKVSKVGLGDIRADNNTMSFGKNKYFEYNSDNGKSHLLYTNNKGISSVYSEYLRGEPYDAELERYAGFWNYMMSKDPVYIGLSYSDEQVREYLDEAGIKTGFFTVQMGDREATQFYSATKTGGVIHSKERYDEQYESLTSQSHLLSDYKPGDIFTIKNKEYVLSESHTLDIPYGEDIFDLKNPSNYYYGKRIE